MKNLLNVALVLFAVALLSNSVFAQERKLDGTGNPDAPKFNWVDVDGDGICDNTGLSLDAYKRMNRQNNGSGIGDGSGKGFGDGSGVRPQDGSGFGKINGGNKGNGGTSLKKFSGFRVTK